MSKFKENQNDLRIKLDEIKESGYHLSCSKNKGWIQDLFGDIKNTDFTFIDDIRIRMEVFRTGESISISGLINTTLKLSCIRCLDNFDFPLETEFKYNLYPSEEREVLPEIEINRKDLDVLYYQGNSIDISPLIREQIILSIPSYSLCRESCKGMCPQCGSNLNQGSCQCGNKEIISSKFEVLKHFPVKH